MVSREDVVWDALEQIGDKYGLEHDFDYVHVQDLGETTPAMTQHDIHGSGTGDTHLVVDNYLDRYGDGPLETVLVHEILHSNQFNGDFGQIMHENYGISAELGDRLNQVMERGDRSEIEGMTQALTNKIVDDGELNGRYFYPYETREFEKMLEDEDFDLDEELLGDDYSDNYDIEIGDDFVYQTGEIKGIEYELLLVGDEANNYLEKIDEMYDLGIDEGYGAQPVQENNYGESPNSVGNIDEPHIVPDTSSMGTGPGFSDQFGEL